MYGVHMVHALTCTTKNKNGREKSLTSGTEKTFYCREMQISTHLK